MLVKSAPSENSLQIGAEGTRSFTQTPHRLYSMSSETTIDCDMVVHIYLNIYGSFNKLIAWIVWAALPLYLGPSAVVHPEA
jgi:hypothetical protein